MKTTKLVCEICGTSNIETKAWIDPNDNTVLDDLGCGREDNWCRECEQHVDFKVISCAEFKHPDADDYVTNCEIIALGKTREEPENWGIEILIDGVYETSLYYDNKQDYNHDLETFDVFYPSK